MPEQGALAKSFCFPVSWQDHGITCTRFLHYANPCLLAGSSSAEKECYSTMLTLSYRKHSQSTKGLGYSRATQLWEQLPTAHCGVREQPLSLPPAESEDSLTNPSTASLVHQMSVINQAGRCRTLTQLCLDLLFSHVDSWHM